MDTYMQHNKIYVLYVYMHASQDSIRNTQTRTLKYFIRAIDY